MPLALGVAVVAIAFASIFFKQAAPTHPLAAAGLRLAIAAAVLAPFTLRAIRRGAMRGHTLRIAALAGVVYAVHFGTWVASLELTSVAASVTLVTASPLFLAVVAFVSGRDRPPRRLWYALGLGVVGIGVIGAGDLAAADSGGGADTLLGDALAVVGAIAMACYLLLARSLGPSLDVWAFSGVATAVGAAALGVTALLTGAPWTPASADALMFIALAALVPQLIGHTLLTWSLRHVVPMTVGLVTLGEPVGAAFLAWFWLAEVPAGLTAIGCALTVAATALALTARR